MIDRELLHNTLSVQSASKQTSAMNKYIRRFARKIDGVDIYEENGNIYITRGDAHVYPCIIAHTDTVHSIIKNFVVNFHKGTYIGKNRDTGKPHGCGGDDKVGIAIALQALRDYDTIKVAFFRDEEIGCVGSGQAYMPFFSDCAFVAQCDRRGNSDVVNSIYGTSLYDKAFSEAVAPFLRGRGFKETSGQLTDVYALRKQGLAVASFNMSAGYHKPHTAAETVSLEDVCKTYDFITDCIENLADRQWIAIPEVSSPFSFFDEEEEEESESDGFDNDDIIYVGGRSTDGWLEQCPQCQENDLEWDDSVGAQFCMICLDYVFVAEEMEVS